MSKHKSPEEDLEDEWDAQMHAQMEAEDAAWNQWEEETKEKVAEILRCFPTQVLVPLRRILAIEAQQDPHANRDPHVIPVTIRVIEHLVLNRGDIPDDPAWEQSTVRQVLAEFPDATLKFLAVALRAEKDEFGAPVAFLDSRVALVTDILHTRTRGPGRIDIDESARAPTKQPMIPLWWDGPPQLPDMPSDDDHRRALTLMITASRLNITELGWYPKTMTMEEALAIYDAWIAWSEDVSLRWRDQRRTSTAATTERKG